VGDSVVGDSVVDASVVDDSVWCCRKVVFRRGSFASRSMGPGEA